MKSLKSMSIVLTAVMGLSLIATPAFAGRSKMSAEDVAALEKIGIDINSTSSEDIEKKAEAIEKLVNALKGLSEARMLEAKARQEEAKAAKDELKLKMEAEKAAMKLAKERQKIADKKEKAEKKAQDETFIGGLLDGLNGTGKAIGTETQKGSKKATKTAIGELIDNIFD